MIQEINRHLADILAERSLDWRSCYTNVATRPPDGWPVVCECSDASVLDELRARIVTADKIQYDMLPRPADGLPEGLIASSSVADVRRAPNHASELVTQVIYGDAVEPLKEEGEWYLVRLDDSYIGWIRNWHLTSISSSQIINYTKRASHRVAVNHAAVLQRPETDALPVTDLVIGTAIEVGDCGKRGWRAVTLPDGREGFIASRAIEKARTTKRISRDRLSAVGLRFLGIPYIWGGTTPKGFDCSGLIQRIFRLNGALIPRDADLQSRFGLEKTANSAGAVQDLATGDLIFFGKSAEKITHVAMFLSEHLFLHASGQVRVGSLDPHSPLFEANLAADWRLTRDVVSYLK